jgi:molybdate transport system ATP-binding protein
MQHVAIFLPNTYNKQLLIQQLLEKRATGLLAVFNSKDIQLFSGYTLQQYLHEEDIHGYAGIEATTSQTLRSMSSGEQKKVLLQHLLSLQPDVLILDNVFDNLDTSAQQLLKVSLEQASSQTIFIQLLHRQRELLPFIQKKLSVNQQQEFVTVETDTITYAESGDQLIPAPLQQFNLVSEELVRFKDVKVSYDGRQVLQQINWTISKGEFWQLKGPNGSGKTTLLTMITGDNVKGYGQELYLFGRKKGSGGSVWDIKSKIGYLTPAMTDLFSTRHTLEQMIVSGFVDQIGLYSIPSDMQQRLAFEWLQLLQLEQKAKLPFNKLSAGEQRLALIARAMVKHPPLLILDEPLMALDDANAATVIRLINKLAAETSTAIIYVSSKRKRIGTAKSV